MQYTEGSQLNFDEYIDLLKTRRAAFDKAHPQKIDYPYQELGIEMQRFFGRNIWYLFYKYKEDDIREAFTVCERKGKRSVPYLIGIIKHKYTGFEPRKS